MAKVTDDEIRRIRQRAASGEKQDNIAAAFGLSHTETNYIIHRKRWAHVK